jgi:hypothetical protein
MLLSGTSGRWFAGRAAVMLSIGSPESSWRGLVPMVIGILGNLFYGLPFALLLVLIAEVLFAAGPGKWILRMSVTAQDGTCAPVGKRFLRWAVKCAGLWGAVLALSLGSGAAALVALASTAIVLAGFVPAAGPGRLALHDRLSGTAVCSMMGPGS